MNKSGVLDGIIIIIIIIIIMLPKRWDSVIEKQVAKLKDCDKIISKK